MFVDNGDAQNRAREKAGFLVKCRIETQIGIGVRNVDRLARGEHRAGNAQMVGQANLHRVQSLTDFRPEFVGLLVVQKQRRALGVQQAGCLAHDLLQQRAKLDVGRDLGNDVNELHLLAPNGLHALDELSALQCQRALAGHGFQQMQILPCKFARTLVQRLRHADDFALHRLDRHAQNAVRGKAGLLINRAVKAGVGIGIGNDQPFAGAIDVAGNAAGIEDANLALDIALGHARVKLIGIRIIEEQRAALGIQLGRGHFHQGLQHFVQRAVSGHAAGDFQQQFDMSKAAPAFAIGFG